MWAGRHIDHHATLPGGLLVLAIMTSVVGPDLLPEQVATVLIATLAAIGGVLALVIGVAFGYTLFTGDPPAESVNGSWFIPTPVSSEPARSASSRRSTGRWGPEPSDPTMGSKPCT